MGWWGGLKTDGGSTTDGAPERGTHGAATATSVDTHKKRAVLTSQNTASKLAIAQRSDFLPTTYHMHTAS